MHLLLNSIAGAWMRALAAIGGEVIAWRHSGSGLEARVIFGRGPSARYLLVRWYPAEGVLCQGRKDDILRFHEACAHAGFSFELTTMSLCG